MTYPSQISRFHSFEITPKRSRHVSADPTRRLEHRLYTTPPAIAEEDYSLFVDAVAECWIKTAMVHPEWFVNIVSVLDSLPAHAREAALQALHQLDPETLPPEARTELSTSIEALVRRHQRDEIELTDELDMLLMVSRGLKPDQAWDSEHLAFRDWNWELGGPYEESIDGTHEEIRLHRSEVVRAVLDRGGMDALTRLAEEVDLPGELGETLAEVSDEGYDLQVVSQLGSDNAILKQFAIGFCRARQLADPAWERRWVQRSMGEPKIQARLLLYLHSTELECWREARALGPDVSDAYWAEIRPSVSWPRVGLTLDIVDHLLAHGQDAKAVLLLGLRIGDLERSFPDLLTRGQDAKAVLLLGPGIADFMGSLSPDLVLRALRGLVGTASRDDIRGMPDEIGVLLAFLRISGVPDVDVAELEWRLLSALGSKLATPSLDRLLTQDPSFLVEPISVVFGVDPLPGSPT